MAVLVGFTLKTHTIDNDKDADTGIFVEVRDINGSIIGGAPDYSDYDNTKHYDNGSINQFSIAPNAPNIPKEQCLPCSWRMGIRAKGSDKWGFDAWLFVVFSDNTSTYGDKLGQELDSTGSLLVTDDFSYTHNTAGAEAQTAKEVEERLKAVKTNLAKKTPRQNTE